MQVSFGQKIPIALGQIQNKKTGEFEQATIYEVDCKDESDILEVKNNMEGWSFPCEIATNMHIKQLGQNKYNNKHEFHSFYILQNPDYETLGRIDLKKWDNGLFSVEWLDTKENSGYRYVGQTILATIAKEVIDNDGSSLAILGAMEDAIPFYTDVCKFTDCGKSGFYMNEKQMQEFINRTEKRTQGSIINLKV